MTFFGGKGTMLLVPKKDQRMLFLALNDSGSVYHNRQLKIQAWYRPRWIF